MAIKADLTARAAPGPARSPAASASHYVDEMPPFLWVHAADTQFLVESRFE